MIEPTYLQRKVFLRSLLKMLCWLKISFWPRPWRPSRQLWVIFLNNYMQCNLHQSYTMEDATFVEVLISQAHAWFKMTQLTRSTTWEIRIVKDSIKVDHRAFIREVIFRRAKVGDLIQGIISTKEVHLISLWAKSRVDKRNPLSWKTCRYNSCRGPSHIKRVPM